MKQFLEGTSMKKSYSITGLFVIIISLIFIFMVPEPSMTATDKFEVEVQCNCRKSIAIWDLCGDARLYTVSAKNLSAAKVKAKQKFKKEAKCKGTGRRIKIIKANPLSEDLRYLKWKVTVQCSGMMNVLDKKTYNITGRSILQARRIARREYRKDFPACNVGVSSYIKIIKVEEVK